MKVSSFFFVIFVFMACCVGYLFIASPQRSVAQVISFVWTLIFLGLAMAVVESRSLRGLGMAALIFSFITFLVVISEGA